MNTDFVLTEEIAKRVLDTVDAGLCSGVGEPVPGQMCVMAAINYALGREHGDNPEICVGSAVREFDIKLNDSNWSSNEARARGMRAEAIAKLGSNHLDQEEFAKRIALKTVQQIVPIALRTVVPLTTPHSDGLEAAALACELAVDLVQARAAARVAAGAAAYDAAYDAAYAVARDAARAAARAAAYAVAGDVARDAARTAAYAASAATPAKRDSILTLAANLAKGVLVEMGSEGSKYLYLIQEDR
jgi:hypothetical protein